MTKEEFRYYMEFLFDNIEKSASYYWEYYRQLKVLDLVNQLAYSNGLISKSVFEKTDRFIKEGVARYEFKVVWFTYFNS